MSKQKIEVYHIKDDNDLNSGLLRINSIVFTYENNYSDIAVEITQEYNKSVFEYIDEEAVDQLIDFLQKAKININHGEVHGEKERVS